MLRRLTSTSAVARAWQVRSIIFHFLLHIHILLILIGRFFFHVILCMSCVQNPKHVANLLDFDFTAPDARIHAHLVDCFSLVFLPSESAHQLALPYEVTLLEAEMSEGLGFHARSVHGWQTWHVVLRRCHWGR